MTSTARRSVLTALALALSAVLMAACGGADKNPARIRAAIADAPQCPAPPAGFSHSGARSWLAACKRVASVAADNVARGIAEAERRRDIIWKRCLSDKHAAIVGLGRRISAERIALSGLHSERAVARIRRHCTRVQVLVAEAQHCV